MVCGATVLQDPTAATKCDGTQLCGVKSKELIQSHESQGPNSRAQIASYFYTRNAGYDVHTLQDLSQTTVCSSAVPSAYF